MNNRTTSFYDPSELPGLRLGKYGSSVLISRKASLYNAENIELGNHARIDDFCILSGGSGISIGSFVHIAPYSALYGGSGIEILDYSCLSSRVAIYSESDDFSGDSMTNPTVSLTYKPKYQRGTIFIGKHAIIGTNATILPGVSVGEGVSIGAYSLVNRSCQPWHIYGGIPARILKPRSRALLKYEAALRNETSSL